MASFIIWILDRLQPLFRAMGADYKQLRAIVYVKLTMDNRRSTITLGRYGQQSSESNNNFLRILAIYTVVGGIISWLMLTIPDRDMMFFPLTFQFAYIMALCAMTLISDFSSVILDSADNQIILPRPVSSRTLWLARVVHITSYLFAIALSLSIAGVGIATFRFGALAGLLLFTLSLLSAVLMVFLTNIFYLLLMRFISEEKLREVINYFQIAMAILFYGGYQLIPRMVDVGQLVNRSFTYQWWHFLIPPMWMAGAVDTVIRPALDTTHLIFMVLALVTPFAGLWFMSRFLTSDFTQKLSGIDQESRPEVSTTSATTTPLGQSDWVQRLAGWFSSNPLERAAFAFAWHITGRDRKFKLKTYPQLGFGLAYTVVMSIQGGSLSKSGSYYLFSLYFAGIYVMVAQYQLSVSDNFRASWIYGSAPIHEPGSILSGAIKALIIKLLIPFYALISAYILYRYGLDKINDVLLAFSNSLVMLLCASFLSTRYMPFSIEPDALKQNNTARGLMVGLILGVVGFSHYGLKFVPYGVWVAIPFSLAIGWLLLQQYKKTDWNQISMG